MVIILKEKNSRPLPQAVVIVCLLFTFLLLAAFRAVAAPAEAARRQFNGFFEAGSRDTSELFEESDLDYSYNKFYLRWDDRIAPEISWAATYQTVGKNYDQQKTLDNYYRRWQTFWELLKEFQDAYFKIDLDGEFKEQIFSQSAGDNQRTKLELGLAYNKEQDYFGRWRIGAVSYKYPENPDKSESGIRQKIEAGKYFFEGKLRLEAAYQKEDLDRTTASDRSQSVKKLGLIYRSKTDWLDTFRLAFSQGQRNTREDEDDDFLIDYNFAEWAISSKHEILPKITTTFKYENETRDYLIETRYNNYGYTAEVNFKYEPIFQKLYYNFDFGWRARNYPVDLSSTNTKRFVVLKGVWCFEPSFRAALEAELDFYRYRENGNSNRNVWNIKPSVEKEISPGLKMTLDYKWCFKDYSARDDTALQSVRAGVKWEF